MHYAALNWKKTGRLPWLRAFSFLTPVILPTKRRVNSRNATQGEYLGLELSQLNANAALMHEERSAILIEKNGRRVKTLKLRKKVYTVIRNNVQKTKKRKEKKNTVLKYQIHIHTLS